MRTAIGHLERAVELDPAFAEAHAALGTAYLVAGSHQGFLDAASAQPRARKALLEAVTLKPGLATAQDSLGDYYNCIERQPLLAKRAFDSAFAINPYLASTGLTRLLFLHDDRDAAVARIEANLARYPNSVWQQVVAAQHFKSAGAFERAREEAEKAVASAPAMTEARLTRAKVLSELGEHDAALKELEALLAAQPDSVRLASATVVALARAGRQDDAAALYNSVIATATDVSTIHLAITNAWLGNTDAAFAALATALAEREFGLCYIAVEPVYAPLRSDPRFEAIVREMRGG